MRRACAGFLIAFALELGGGGVARAQDLRLARVAPEDRLELEQLRRRERGLARGRRR